MHKKDQYIAIAIIALGVALLFGYGLGYQNVNTSKCFMEFCDDTNKCIEFPIHPMDNCTVRKIETRAGLQNMSGG